MSELVENVARAISFADWGRDRWHTWNADSQAIYMQRAQAVIPIILAEAAKVARETPVNHDDFDPGERIATAIERMGG